MLPVSQVTSVGDICIEGHNNNLTFNQIIQISVDEIKQRKPIATSPYRGLRRFNEVDRDFFFGRDRLVSQLLERVVQRNLVLLAGASGSGKSSVVRAGLLPQLRARLPQGRFHELVMTPDRDPFQSLRVSMQAAEVSPSRLQALDARTADSLVQMLSSQRRGDALLLLFVDQFEQIFTLCTEVAWRGAFLTGLTRLAEAPQNEIKIVLAMRADFFDRFGPYPEFAALAQQGIQLAVDMQASELRAAIEQPAAHHGMVFEAGLVNQIIADVQGRPGALPLLQYTLDLLWSADNPVDDRTLNTRSYHQIGGVAGALQQRADALYCYVDAAAGIERPKEQKEAIRQIFLRLVDLTSPGANSHAVSRPTPLAHFTTLAEQQIISELVEEKLLVSDAPFPSKQGVLSASATVEIAHEALLDVWLKLKGWIEQAREVIYVRKRLAHDALDFVKVAAHTPELAADELWSGTRLAQALELRASGDFRALLGELSPQEETFLNASEARKSLLEQEAAERLRREREAAEKNLQLLLDTYIDRGHQLLFEKNQPYPAVLWLHRAYKEGSKNPALPDLLKSAMLQVDATKAVLSGHAGHVLSAIFNPDRSRILTASADKTARVWDADDGRLLTVLAGHGGDIHGARYSPDGRCILTASADHTARVWDAEHGRLLTQLSGHSDSVLSAMFSFDGRRILTVSADHTARVWDAEHGHLLTVLKWRGVSLLSARFSPDGRRVLTASEDYTARVWDTEQGRVLAELIGHKNRVYSARFSPDGRRVLTASSDDTVRVWDAERGSLLSVLTGDGHFVLSARFSPDGRRVLTACWDNTARIWDAEHGRLLTQLAGHEDSVRSARYSPDGRYILTAGADKTPRVWDAEHGRLLTQLVGHGGSIASARFSSDSSRILTASYDNTARVWDTEHGSLLTELTGHESDVLSVGHSPDGRLILTASADKTVRLWSAERGGLLTKLTGHGGSVLSARFSPDGQRILTASEDHTARVWDAQQGRLLIKLTGHGSYVNSARFSPDGQYILTASRDRTAKVWDAEQGLLLTELIGHGNSVLSARYSPDGRRILTASADRTARIWDAEQGLLLTELTGHGSSVLHGNNLLSARYSPDGRRVLTTTSSDKTARVWNAEDGCLLAELTGHRGSILSARFSPDGRLILTASSDHTARVWDAEDGRLLAELTGHGDRVESARYSPDGRRILTASWDATARVWVAANGQLLTELTGHRSSVQHAKFSPDGRRILTASKDHTVRVWDASPETRTPEHLTQVLRPRSCVRFEPEDGNVIVPCTPSPVDSEDKSRAFSRPLASQLGARRKP